MLVLDDLYVHPDFRGQRLSELLIKELQKISKEKNWNLVRWITREDNTRAKIFMIKSPIKPIGMFTSYYNLNL